MAIHDRDFDDERCKNCSVNAKCYACDIFLHPEKEKIMLVCDNKEKIDKEENKNGNT